MRHYLLPVWGIGRFSSALLDVGLGEDDWWDKPPLCYPHTLISYVHWQRAFEFPTSAYVFGDSGGFSLRSTAHRHMYIDPVDVLYWQATLCTVGCLLDIPPLGGDWNRTLDATLHHTRAALPHYEHMRRDGTSFRWWGVLHGEDDVQVRSYHRAISAIYPFADEGEGWAIRAEPTVNIYNVARSLRTLHGLGVRRAHFLAATNQKVIAVLLALGQLAGLELVTFDSAYAIKTGMNRHVFQPKDDGRSFRSCREKGDETRARDFLHDCPCRVCSFMRKRSEVVPKARRELDRGNFGGWWSCWAQLHNLHIQGECTSAQASFAASAPNDLLRIMLTAKEYARVIEAFEA